MGALRKPRALPRGGTIGIAAPAAAVDLDVVAAGAKRWREAGFDVVHRDDLGARRRYLAGDDARRADELAELWTDQRVDAIVCARGGYGCHRIADRLDTGVARGARKPLVGYSDVTTLLLWQRRCARLVGFHGPMLERGGAIGDDEFGALVEMLTGTERLPVVRDGDAGAGHAVEGPLVGGSLSLVAASLGTPWEIDARGAILLLEDVAERPYRLDRMLEQLRNAGVLDGVAGVGFGHFDRCDEADGSITAREILGECAEQLGVPWVAGLPFGHGAPNLAWPFGVHARLDGDGATLHILERGVETGGA
ncbi:MAG: LD-carboxypeptidase [Proteobacteria bacterium]|nr:MAG: LD-carboxypeptidase [Pseudomonadota bacterium]